MGDRHALRIEGRGGGKAGSSTPTEAPNTLQSDAVATLLFLCGEGPFQNVLANGLQSLFFDGVPVGNPDGSVNFTVGSVQTRVGTPDQDPIAGFPDVETVLQVGVEAKNGVPVVQAIADTDATSVILTVQIPALVYIDPQTGNVLPTGVTIAIDLEPSGGSFAEVTSDTILGKCTSPYVRSYLIQLAGTGPWNLRLRRLSLDSGSAGVQNQTLWQTYTVIKDFQLSYPNSALLAVEVDAQVFGSSLPTVEVESDCFIGPVPSNWDPVTRAYTGLWDGTFRQAFHDHPAWVLYALATNPRFGAGAFLPAGMTDKFTLYGIAQYCDQLVPDGAGGQEPRYRFNGWIDTPDDPIRVIANIAAVFMGMPFWGGNGLSAYADMPGDSVRIVTPANSVTGRISYSGIGLKARHTVALVTWFNPDIGYKSDLLPVELDPQLIAKRGWRPLPVTALGCTSRGQAYRTGLWLLEAENLETATWTASYDQADVIPGEIVDIVDRAYSSVDFAGRVAGVTLTSGAVTGLTSDRPIVFENGKTYSVSVMLPDGTIGRGALTNAPGTTAALALAAALTQQPLPGAIWAIKSSSVAPRQFRILSRRESDPDKHLFEIVATFHDPTKYARIEQNVILEAPSYTALPSGPLPAPTNLTTREGFTLAGGTTAHAQCVVSWSKAADPRVLRYQVQIKFPGQDWQDAGFSTGVSLDILDLQPGAYGFRVRSLDGLGNVSPTWLTGEGINLLGTSAPPNALTGLVTAYNSQTGRLQLAWDESIDLRPYRYEVRKGPDVAGALQVGDQAHPPFVTLGDGTYWVNVYVGPAQGPRIYGSAWASIEVAGSVLVQNVVVEHDEAVEGWTGTFTGTAGKAGPNIATSGATNMLAVASILPVPSVLNMGGQASGFYASKYVVSLGRVMPFRTSATWAATGAPPDQNILADPNVLANPDELAGGLTRLVDVYPVIRLGTGSPDAFAPSDIYAQDDAFLAGVTFTSWQRWTTDVQNAAYVQFGMVLDTDDPSAEAVATTFKWLVDVDDRVDSYANLTIPDTGLALTFAKGGTPSPFIGGPGADPLPHVAPFLANPQSGDQIKVLDGSLTLTGCTLVVVNGGSQVTRAGGGAIVQGY